MMEIGNSNLGNQPRRIYVIATEKSDPRFVGSCETIHLKNSNDQFSKKI